MNEDSDAWLSEQLFAQLKDFNTQYNDKLPTDANPDVIDYESKEYVANDDIFTDLNLSCTDFDSLEVFGINPTINALQVTYQPYDPQTDDQCEKALLLNEQSAEQYLSYVNDENEFGTSEVPFDASDEEILRYLESAPEKNPSTVKPSDNKNAILKSSIKCSNCSCIFDSVSFEEHICDHDEHHNLIIPLPASMSKTPEVQKPPAEPACFRLLRENQIRIRRFLKDELKYDIHASFTNGNSSSANNNSHNNTANSSIYLDSTLNASSGCSSVNSSKKQDGPHECSLCERKFVHASGLLRHMEKHALDLIPTPGAQTCNKSSTLGSHSLYNSNGLRVVVKCTLCGRIFFEPLSAYNHFCDHFPGKILEEEESEQETDVPYESYVDEAIKFLFNESNSQGQSIPEKSNTTYLKIVILNCILQCEFCDYIFSEVSLLLIHSASHQPHRRFECLSCDIMMRTSKEIYAHFQAECVYMRENLKINNANTMRYFVCNVCENKFQSMDLLHEHRYTAYHFFPRFNKFLGILQVPCEFCDAVLLNAQDCIFHYEEKHYKKYKRDKDNSGVSTKARQYLCDVCGKSYTQSSHLWQHLRFHKGVKPFACKEPGCTRKFTIRPDLNDHIRKCHTGERPYHCLICGKRFLTGSVFYQHRLIHRGERRYECDECGKRFYRADALKNHQRIHTGEKPFGCLFCTKHFRQRGDRDKHIRARHAHLDANSRLMMQMQKLQLEAAAAAAKQKTIEKSDDKENIRMPGGIPPAYTSEALCKFEIPEGFLQSIKSIENT